MNLTIEIPDAKQPLLAAKAREQSVSAEQYASQVLQQELEQCNEEEGALPRKHISEIIAENMRDVPPEELALLPVDGASQVDHYLYGHPKR